jgi:hypothetical protein
MMTEKRKFTPNEINQWRRFENVRKGGAVNMMDQSVQGMAELTRDQHFFILMHYSEIKDYIEEGGSDDDRA